MTIRKEAILNSLSSTASQLNPEPLSHNCLLNLTCRDIYHDAPSAYSQIADHKVVLMKFTLPVELEKAGNSDIAGNGVNKVETSLGRI